MTEIIIMVLSGTGTLFILLAAVGFLRMPDFYLRVSVTTKAATLGIGLLLGSAACYFAEISIVSRVIAIIFFLLLTAPVAAHMIGRAAYFIGTPLWKGSVIDELENMYQKETDELLSDFPEQEEKTPQ